MGGYIVGDKKERWDWLPAVANVASGPTLAEIAAGMRISTNMLEATGFAPETAAVPTSGIEDGTDTSIPGRRSFSGMKHRFKTQPGTDTVRNTLAPDAPGVLMRRKSINVDTAYASGQKVSLFPVAVGEPFEVDFEPNMPERYDVPYFLTATQNLRATVA